jgi:hypothetical protein
MSIKLKNKASRVIVFASNPKNIMAIPNKEIEITEEQYNVLKQLNTFENYVNKGEVEIKFDAPVAELEKKIAEPVKVVEEFVEVEKVEAIEVEKQVEEEEEKPKRRGRRKKG